MKNYLYIIFLEGCPYSKNALKNIKDTNKEYKIKQVNQETKEEYKNNSISTFPQIYYVKHNIEKKKLIGGDAELQRIIALNNDLLRDPDNINKNIKNFIKNNSFISKRLLLRVLHYLNNTNNI